MSLLIFFFCCNYLLLSCTCSADVLYLCYCIDKDSGHRRREEVFSAVSSPVCHLSSLCNVSFCSLSTSFSRGHNHLLLVPLLQHLPTSHRARSTHPHRHQHHHSRLPHFLCRLRLNICPTRHRPHASLGLSPSWPSQHFPMPFHLSNSSPPRQRQHSPLHNSNLIHRPRSLYIRCRRLQRQIRTLTRLSMSRWDLKSGGGRR